MTKIVITGLVGVHLVVAIWHGGAHTELAIALPPLKSFFVYAVVLLAPIAAAALAWTRYLSTGLWLFLLSMLGSYLFGVYHHYVLISPDNIGHLPPGSVASHSHFIVSAAVLALTELFAALWGAFALGVQHAQPQET